MPDIYARRQHGMTQEEARRMAEGLAQRLAEQYGLTYEWRGDELRFTRSGVDGRVHVSPTDVVAEAKLGFLLKPMRARIQQRVDRYLDDHLA